MGSGCKYCGRVHNKRGHVNCDGCGAPLTLEYSGGWIHMDFKKFNPYAFIDHRYVVRVSHG